MAQASTPSATTRRQQHQNKRGSPTRKSAGDIQRLDSASSAAAAATKIKSSYKHIPHSQKPPHLVAKRNARERRRVQAVNQAFYKLRRSVPIENRNKRVSKVKTLQRAIDYIRKLERILAEDDESGSVSTSQQQQQYQDHSRTSEMMTTTTTATAASNTTAAPSRDDLFRPLEAGEQQPARVGRPRAQNQTSRTQAAGGPPGPPVVKQKRGRKPKAKLAEQQLATISSTTPAYHADDEALAQRAQAPPARQRRAGGPASAIFGGANEAIARDLHWTDLSSTCGHRAMAPDHRQQAPPVGATTLAAAYDSYYSPADNNYEPLGYLHDQPCQLHDQRQQQQQHEQQLKYDSAGYPFNQHQQHAAQMTGGYGQQQQHHHHHQSACNSFYPAPLVGRQQLVYGGQQQAQQHHTKPSPTHYQDSSPALHVRAWHLTSAASPDNGLQHHLLQQPERRQTNGKPHEPARNSSLSPTSTSSAKAAAHLSTLAECNYSAGSLSSGAGLERHESPSTSCSSANSSRLGAARLRPATSSCASLDLSVCALGDQFGSPTRSPPGVSLDGGELCGPQAAPVQRQQQQQQQVDANLAYAAYEQRRQPAAFQAPAGPPPAASQNPKDCQLSAKAPALNGAAAQLAADHHRRQPIGQVVNNFLANSAHNQRRLYHADVAGGGGLSMQTGDDGVGAALLTNGNSNNIGAGLAHNKLDQFQPTAPAGAMLGYAPATSQLSM